MEAPSNLLSRYAIEKLWPEIFKDLREVVSVPARNKTTKVPVVLNNTEVKATEVQVTAEKKYIIPAKRTTVPSYAKENATEVSVQVSNSTGRGSRARSQQRTPV